ncbi:uncharacterized protein [Fopius arisanus]|uniref:Odorant receptor n=1 Tax=Fopius arisanus TaxID=64838 RepID=A0A9R1T5J2_9HYME|nr:PREDICTED: uncharacterized protein LOC105266609 [Fopius arisanus]
MMCTMSSSFAAGYLCTVLKNINLIMRQSDILFVLKKFNWERSVSCTRDIVESGWSVDSLPISNTPLRTIAKAHNFWIVCALDFITWSIFTYTVLAHDSFFASLMLQTSTQLDILNHKLKNCTNFEMSTQNETPEVDVIHFDCIEINPKIKNLNPNEELIKCIQHYQRIFQIVKTLQSIFGCILLPQLISSLAMMSLIGFHVFVIKTIDLNRPSKAIFFSVFFGSIFYQLFAFCWSGGHIIEESDKTSVALYSSCWYQGNRSFRVNVMVFASLVQRPMVMSAVGLFDLSIVMYKNIMMKSYSAITILKNAYN